MLNLDQMKSFLIVFAILVFSFGLSSVSAADTSKCFVDIQGCGSSLNCGNGFCCPDTDTCQQLSSENPRVATPNPESTVFCTKGDPNSGINTAIGCLLTNDPKALISQLLSWGVGIGGGIAFILIAAAGLQLTTASGDPKRAQAAKELLTSAISGLILIIISVVLLNFLGVSVLGLGGLGFKI